MNQEDLVEGMVVALGNKKRLYTHTAIKGIVLQVGGWANRHLGIRKIANFRQKPNGKMIAVAMRIPKTDVWVPNVVQSDRVLMSWEDYERFMSNHAPELPPRPKTHPDLNALVEDFINTFNLSEKDRPEVLVPGCLVLKGHALAKILEKYNAHIS